MDSFSNQFPRIPVSISSGWNRNSAQYAYDSLPSSPRRDLEGQSSRLASPQQDTDTYEWTWGDIVHRRPIMRALVTLGLIFLAGSLILGATLWSALPVLEEADRPILHVPKSFEELKALNTLLQKLKLLYPIRTTICFVVTYLYLQAFSLPGSMYLSILAGAVWGLPTALPLVCTCVATGATICYLISSCFGPALFALPKFKAKIDSVATRIGESGHRENIIPYLIVLRMAPLPPHWVLNMACPHLGIGIPAFWTSAFLGIMGVSVIHTTIGGGLERMTSQDDFHLISWGNFFGLSAVMLAVCIGIVVRWKWRQLEIQQAADEEGRMEEYSALPSPEPSPRPRGSISILPRQTSELDLHHSMFPSPLLVRTVPRIEIVAPNGLGLSGMLSRTSIDVMGDRRDVSLVPLPPTFPPYQPFSTVDGERAYGMGNTRRGGPAPFVLGDGDQE